MKNTRISLGWSTLVLLLLPVVLHTQHWVFITIGVWAGLGTICVLPALGVWFLATTDDHTLEDSILSAASASCCLTFAIAACACVYAIIS